MRLGCCAGRWPRWISSWIGRGSSLADVTLDAHTFACRETLSAHQAHWTEEPDPARHELPRLRLEQERIGYDWVRSRLAAELI